jgi:glycosyltransferase involved in cell wall biosynthesis
VVARHDREKSLDRLIRLFDEHVAAKAPDATLTLLGDGALHGRLKDQASRSRSRQRIFLPGEVAFGALADWYRNADVFVYTSLSETFGNVVNEALYCGLPVVAFDDRMGVASQVQDGANGRLIAPGTATAEADWGRSCLDLLGDPARRATLGQRAAALAAERGRLDTVLERLELLMERARQHCRATVVAPLAALSQAEQERSLRSSLRWWCLWNSLFISLSYSANLDRLPGRLAQAVAHRSSDAHMSSDRRHQG